MTGKTFPVGEVVFDLLPIKQHVQLYNPKDRDDGEQRYEVTVLFKMRLIDKYLDFTAYWPAGDQPQVTIKGCHKHLNVVSAFKPGTV